jgi:hypothetical protein
VEARTEFRGEGISKSLVVVVAVSITMALGVGAGVAAKNLSLTAAPQTHKIVQGLGGAAQENPGRRGGVQFLDGNSAAAVKAVGPDDRPNTIGLTPAEQFDTTGGTINLTPAYQQVDTRGVKPAAISTLQVDTRGIIPAEAFGQAQLARPTLASARGHRWI